MNNTLREALTALIEDAADADALDLVVADFSEEQREELAETIDEQRTSFKSNDNSGTVDLGSVTAAEIAALLVERPELKDALKDLFSTEQEDESSKDESQKDGATCSCGKTIAGGCDCGEDQNDADGEGDNIEDSAEDSENGDSMEDNESNSEDDSVENKETTTDSDGDGFITFSLADTMITSQPSLSFSNDRKVVFSDGVNELVSLDFGAVITYETSEGAGMLANVDTNAGLEAETVPDFADAISVLSQEQKDHLVSLAQPKESFVNTLRSVAERLGIQTEDSSVEELAAAIETKVSTASNNVSHNNNNNEPRVADMALARLQGFAG